jgi:hypothetical protein
MRGGRGSAKFVAEIGDEADIQRVVWRDAYRSAVRRWPGGVITLRQGARVIKDSPGTRMASRSDKGRKGAR